MKLLRRLFALICLFSFLLWLLFAFLLLRSQSTMDVWMLPLPSNETLLITSHRLHLLEIAVLKNWPTRQFSHWSGEGWQNVGPFRFWQIHHMIGWKPQLLGIQPLGEYGIWGYEGYYVTPRQTPGGPLAFVNSFDRANQLGYPGPITWSSPDWFYGYARELKFPFRILMRYTAILPALWLILLLARFRRQRIRKSNHLCLHCGYDFRASTDKCPECGQPIPVI